MVKTLKEWFDNLPSAAQEYVLRKCSWIDLNAPDYYLVKTPGLKNVKEIFEKHPPEMYWSNNYAAEVLYNLVAELSEDHKDIFTKYNVDGIFDYAKYNSENVNDVNAYLPVAERRKKLLQYDNSVYDFSAFLFVQEDFSKFDLTKLRCSCGELNLYVMLFGKEAVKSKLLDNINLLPPFHSMELNDDIFDELFFGENGFSDTQKERIIKAWYTPNLGSLDDFLRRIVAVDESYLLYLDTIVKQNPALASEAYQAKKYDDELTGNETVSETYRYPKYLRQLLEIAGCCARERIPKTRVAKCGDLACMLKLYNFNYRDIFKAMRPELFAEEMCVSSEQPA